MKKKILIFIISYKASFRLNDVYKKIPFKKLKMFNINLLFSDDASKDDSINLAKKIKNNNKSKKIFINENKKNLGYGAHIKKCLNFAIKRKFDYAIMIHGDGQYDPIYIPNLIRCLIKDNKISAATGSRTLNGFRSAKRGGMPFYKLIGNIILTQIFNYLTSQNFTDAHTGLWAYNLSYLKNKKFNYLTNSFNFDQEFRFRNIIKKRFIKEIPIKTKYGDERSQLHIKYAIKFFFNSLFFYFVKNKLIKSKKFE